jgi:hypothetical protein
MMRHRVIITGSRNWEDRAAIERILDRLWVRDQATVIVHGGCPTGADAMAEEIWSAKGGITEVHPADWSAGRAAGPIRNQMMVNMGADWCVAFIRNSSPGASGCAEMARRAGIIVHRVEADT